MSVSRAIPHKLISGIVFCAFSKEQDLATTTALPGGQESLSSKSQSDFIYFVLEDRISFVAQIGLQLTAITLPQQPKEQVLQA